MVVLSSGILTIYIHILGVVFFHSPPHGEGTVEEVFINDLRPLLDWYPEHGWMVPTQDGGRACAVVIGPTNPVPVEDDTKNCVKVAEKSTRSSDKLSVYPSSSSIPE